MVFSSSIFLFVFLPAVLTLWFVLPQRLSNLALLISSLTFYAWGEQWYVLLMIASSLLNYLFGLAVEPGRDNPRSRIALAIAVVFNIGLLAVFKYAGFFVGTLNQITGLVGRAPLPAVDLHLPIGISFFTFQALSYVVDIYRGETKALRNPLDAALYISLFPQLIAGPIVRFRQIADQIRHRTRKMSDVSWGITRFTIGLAKKVLVANIVAVPADRIFALPAAELNFGLAWLGLVCYTLQIFFDFSGYSDMAIGLGAIFGFRFPENFRYPYVARSVQEFWRRWHITLSSWFRDYVYIPLGGSRGTPLATYRNLITVFLLCGLWHGASWNFVIWGAYHGAFLVIERVGFKSLLSRTPRLVQHVYLLLVVMLGWVFFRAEGLGYALSYLGALFGLAPETPSTLTVAMLATPLISTALVAGIVWSTPLTLGFWRRFQPAAEGEIQTPPTVALSVVRVVVCCLLWLLCSMELAAGSHNPFLYFRF
ncbi:MAG: MBOAT family protein [Acidobacteriota bacterium]